MASERFTERNSGQVDIVPVHTDTRDSMKQEENKRKPDTKKEDYKNELKEPKYCHCAKNPYDHSVDVHSGLHIAPEH